MKIETILLSRSCSAAKLPVPLGYVCGAHQSGLPGTPVQASGGDGYVYAACSVASVGQF